MPDPIVKLIFIIFYILSKRFDIFSVKNSVIFVNFIQLKLINSKRRMMAMKVLTTLSDKS